MSDYIDREAVINEQKRFCGYLDDDTLFRLELAIKRIPAADVRPVVLCKDCRHRDPEDHKCDCGGMERQGCPFKVADDYFCAYGER